MNYVRATEIRRVDKAFVRANEKNAMNQPGAVLSLQMSELLGCCWTLALLENEDGSGLEYTYVDVVVVSLNELVNVGGMLKRTLGTVATYETNAMAPWIIFNTVQLLISVNSIYALFFRLLCVRIVMICVIVNTIFNT